ncbi:phosphopyruvate hydratase [Candidatus Nomurabacteria bacterium CG_4_10_14_0_2_um_filter_30_12]|uniref:Enolase n=2 Tax=Candidatus Nomuraibacteriota TaxID=1752729 RepID=A0A2J0MRC7_9BACT|nr:MAG: phosphopyruvate hydratase [Candidatus Nomurabacteria bacterium CG10_big_fil_rev_8_21_14_0_10_03_31_7]PIZ87485.1 MAG: phosphopyruvate hydratase [Candidatus Nomurabacteria bacterium CG_4_10_14_0_2_um_filter_30_12]
MENKITKIIAEEINNSRSNPTLKVTVWVDEKFDSFSVPSGASTGIHEAHELHDEDGKGVKNVIEKVNNIIAPALIGQDVLNQREIDRIMIELDGTSNKDNLGGNAMIGVSIACAKTAAKVSNVETFEHLRILMEIKPSRRIPHLYMNLINGGKHAKNDLAFQEYHVVSDKDDASEAVEIGIKIQNSLKEIIEKELGEKSLVLGDEGGFAPKISNIRKPLEYLSKAIKENNLEGKVMLALDVASSSFYNDGKYKVDGQEITKEELMNIYKSLITEFNLLSIEDPFDEEDFESFRKLKENQNNLIVVGDDLTVTNKVLLKEAIEKNSINAMIIKPNQIGTLTETLETMQLARLNDVELIVSHRSGETNDDFIADLAFAFGCFGLKSGAPEKSERKVKYDRLIKISKI